MYFTAISEVLAGGDVQRYTGKNLKITIASEYAIGSRRPPQGKSKRRTHFGAGGFELEGCTALPGQESRNSLQLSRSSGRQQRGPKWNRCFSVIPFAGLN